MAFSKNCLRNFDSSKNSQYFAPECGALVQLNVFSHYCACTLVKKNCPLVTYPKMYLKNFD